MGSGYCSGKACVSVKNYCLGNVDLSTIVSFAHQAAAGWLRACVDMHVRSVSAAWADEQTAAPADPRRGVLFRGKRLVFHSAVRLCEYSAPHLVPRGLSIRLLVRSHLFSVLR